MQEILKIVSFEEEEQERETIEDHLDNREDDLERELLEEIERVTGKDSSEINHIIDNIEEYRKERDNIKESRIKFLQIFLPIEIGDIEIPAHLQPIDRRINWIIGKEEEQFITTKTFVNEGKINIEEAYNHILAKSAVGLSAVNNLIREETDKYLEENKEWLGAWDLFNISVTVGDYQRQLLNFLGLSIYQVDFNVYQLVELHQFVEAQYFGKRTSNILIDSPNKLFHWSDKQVENNYYTIRVNQGKQIGTTKLSLWVGFGYHSPVEGPEKKSYSKAIGKKKTKLGGNNKVRDQILKAEEIEFSGKLLRQCLIDQYKQLEEQLIIKHS
jgi:hypothetical protein